MDRPHVAGNAAGDSSHARDLAIRAHPLVFGVVMFLASETMFFAGLLAAYYDLRGESQVWPPPDVHVDPLWASLGTGLLALSSLTTIVAQRATNGRRFAAARAWFGATVALALAFLAIAVKDWNDAGFTIASHAYGTLFYAITGFHALHVCAGIVAVLLMMAGLPRAAFTRDARAGVEAISYYWHFVFAVWALVYATIYWVR